MPMICAKKSKHKDKEDDIAILLRPHKWPKYPILYMKKIFKPEGISPHLMGIVIASGHRHSVYLHPIDKLPRDIKEYEKFPRQIYNSFEAMLRDGWVVH